MSYTIVRTDGSTLTIIPDGIVNTTSTPLSLPGRNYSSYGVVMDTNFVHQLENFANTTPPENPIRGQLWYDSDNQFLYLCPSDGLTNVNDWIKIYSSNDNNLVFENLNLTGNLTANNAAIDNDLTANHVITNYLTVNVSANIESANLTGTTNITNVRTNLITTGSNSTPGSIVGDWSLDGDFIASTGNIITAGIKSDAYMYANGQLIDFLEAAGSEGYVQFNSGGALSADSGLVYDPATNDLSVQGNISGDDITSTGVFTGVGSGLSALPAANLQGVLPSLVQSSISQVGTLSTLTVVGNINASRLNLSGNVYASYLSGTLITPTQPSITSVGTLTSLVVNGNITSGNVYANLGTIGASLLTGTLTTASQPNITSVGTLSALSVTGNITAGNIAGGNLVSANFVTGTLTTSSQPNITSVGTLTTLNVTENIVSANVTGNLFGNGTGITSIYGPNVTGSVPLADFATSATSATTAGTVTTNAQPNITGVGVLSSLTVSGNVTSGNVITGNLSSTGNVTVSGNLSVVSNVAFTGSNISLGNIDSVHVSGGTSGYVMITDGAGNLSFIDPTTIGSPPFGANTQVQYNNNGAFGASSNFTFNQSTNVLQVSGTITSNRLISTVSTGTAPLSVNSTTQVANLNAATSGTVTASNQPNITQVGTLVDLSVTGSITAGNVATGGNIVGGNIVASNYVIGDGSKLTNLTGANVSGKVANAIFADNASYSANSGNAVNSQNANYASSAGTLVGIVDIQNGGTSANNTQTAGINLGIIGVGQTWQNLTPSRALGTNYTNTTGRSIMVYVKGNAGSGIMTALVDSIEVASSSAGGHTMAVNFLVPPGSTYRVNYTASTLSTWSELR